MPRRLHRRRPIRTLATVTLTVAATLVALGAGAQAVVTSWATDASAAARAQLRDNATATQVRNVTTAVRSLVPDAPVENVTKDGDAFVVTVTKNGEQRVYRVPADLSSATRMLG